MKNLYILGAGGFGHVIKDMAEQCGKYTTIQFEYIKLDRDKSTFKSHRDFCSEKEITFKHL